MQFSLEIGVTAHTVLVGTNAPRDRERKGGLNRLLQLCDKSDTRFAKRCPEGRNASAPDEGSAIRTVAVVDRVTWGSDH
jgi:hypothetical protein